ncbi:MAG: excisionase, partial [Oscillospiraceae bacterium]|nr:excisionase [Oscillospiraceae bacterium]
VPMLDRMIVFDYIIANEDRHYGNFGLLRDPETLEWIGAAPIFDNGTSLWHDRLTSQIPTADLICKPFKKTHGEQLSLVTSFGWLDLSALDGIEDDIFSIFDDEKARKYIDSGRAEMITLQVRKRINRLSEIITAIS